MVQQQETWSSRWTFLMATVGGAVGLGNLWRFPYIAGENGGGAFVVVYLAIVLVIGIPLVMAELALGRRGRGSPVAAMEVLCEGEQAHRGWQALGWMSIIAPPIALCFYSVIASWSMEYIVRAATGSFVGLTGEQAGLAFDGLLASPCRLIMWHTLFVASVAFVVGKGVRGGLERATSVLMPALFVLVIILAIYANLTGDSARAFQFLFNLDFSTLTGESFLLALGQAFFSVTVGAGLLLTYGSYLGDDVDLTKAAWTIALADTVVALMAALAIFPIVFAAGVDPGDGPGLPFISLPVAFGQMPGGQLFGTLFFVLLLFAAFTSGLGMLEPIVAYLIEVQNSTRMKITVFLGAGVWLVGLGSVFSFNIWQDFHPLNAIPLLEGKTIFSLLDYSVSNFFMPVNGVLIALFAAWVMRRAVIHAELAPISDVVFWIWRFFTRFLVPIAIAMVIVFSVSE